MDHDFKISTTQQVGGQTGPQDTLLDNNSKKTPATPNYKSSGFHLMVDAPDIDPP